MKQFPPFALDTVNQCLWHQLDSGTAERRQLTPKAFAVLQHLIEHAGSLVTQTELLDKVWPNVVVQPEVLKSQILDIRRALGDNPKNPLYIETLARRGYRFIAPIRDADSLGPALPAAATPRNRLVGRDQVLANLRECLRMASRGERQIVFVTGEPGIGKTAVVDELQGVAAIEMPGLRIARGQCIEGYGGKEAYYPILEALGQLCRGEAAGSLVEQLATYAPTWLVQFPELLTAAHRESLRHEIMGATRERMLREICAGLETITAERPLLLVLEDLQWVDHSTVDLLSALARRRVSAKLMLLATRRSGEETPSGQPLNVLKQELLSHHLCHEIDLRPLAEAEVAEYLAAESSHDSVPQGLTALVHRHSEGNPLFMVAALDHLTQRGFISKADGTWQLRVPLEAIELEVPESLRQMIEAQIERLSAEERRVLEVASVSGAAFLPEICASAVDGDPESFEETYEALARRHRMVRSAETRQLQDGSLSSRFEFVHALYREVLYHRLPPRTRSKLHRRIGERLRAVYSPNLIAVGPELAHHFELASDWPRAVEYLRLAADSAVGRLAHEEAANILQHALVLAGKLPEAVRGLIETQLLEKLAAIFVMISDMRAIETYETLVARAAHHGFTNTQIYAMIGLAFPLGWISSARSLEVLERALELSADRKDPLTRARMRLSCFFWQVAVGGWVPQDTNEWVESLAQIRRAGDERVLACHLIHYGFIQLCSSEYAAARRSVSEGIAILSAGCDGDVALNIAYPMGQGILPLTLVMLGEWGAALQQTQAAILIMQKNGDHHRARRLAHSRAWLHLNAMDFEGVLSICNEAFTSPASLALSSDPQIPELFVTDIRISKVLTGSAELALGRHQQAREHLLAARDYTIEHKVAIGHWYWWVIVLHSSLTELWLDQGDLSQARLQAERFLDWASATPERAWQALAWEACARVALALNEPDRARDCVTHALRTMEGFDLPLAAWRVHATAAKLFATAGECDLSSRHAELSRETILRLANSLPEDHSLRSTFLAAPQVSLLLTGRPANPKAVA